MNDLCIRDLADIIGGNLRLGTMPPLGGDLEPLGNLVCEPRRIREGDVYWPLDLLGGACYAEDAFLRGAAGAVVSGRRLEPWAGTFSIEVDCTRAAMCRLAAAARQQFLGRVIEITSDQPEQLGNLCYTLLSRHGRGTHHHAGSGWDAVVGLAHVSAKDDFAVFSKSFSTDSEKDEFSHLCCPHGAVITRTATADINPSVANKDVGVAIRQALSALPDQGWMITNAGHTVLQDAARGSQATVHRIASEDGDSAVSHVQRTGDGVSFEIDLASIHVHRATRLPWELVAAAAAVGFATGIPGTAIQSNWSRIQQEMLDQFARESDRVSMECESKGAA